MGDYSDDPEVGRRMPLMEAFVYNLLLDTEKRRISKLLQSIEVVYWTPKSTGTFMTKHQREGNGS